MPKNDTPRRNTARARALALAWPRWLTRREAADYLECSERTVIRMERRGLIKSTKPTTKMVRVDRESIDRYLEQMTG